ncbi:class I SAM-dependent methyltransferase [Streptantibioticus ferralitis]|uniref:Class I SAM-dependent methyltransferase n=1 Tax=Streptantibioticus ferralitis TaxID=236510 RepID=A0ABT5YWW8_9ACTN|nr:class I SAM-dependent methyltransferase [Streptantibioticus ferralitis]MDF2256106.1 class I SAM-dependent methyltransferase [Streptantibioticus ferralitis]
MKTRRHQQYDAIGESYEGFKTLPLARYPEQHSFLRMLGDVTDRSVLDLACGTGFYARQIKRLGAAGVLGLDISPQMVGAARAIEWRAPLGVRYAVADATDLPGIDRFDAVTAVYLLNYADSEQAMERMCAGAFRNLRDGGEFLALTQNPDFRFTEATTAKYGFTYVPTGPGPIDPRVRITALLDPPIAFDTNYPERAVYERALASAGFTDVTWVPLEVPGAAEQVFSPGFWDDFLANPPLIMLRCHR